MSQTNKSTFGKVIAYIVNKLWLLFAISIIVTALCFTFLRLTLPHLNYFKSDIEQWVESNFGIEIEFESVNGAWDANGPVLSASNIKIKSRDGQLSLVTIDSLLIYIDGFSSLLDRQLVTENVDITGASLSFILDRQLGVRFEPLEEAQEKDSTQFEEASQIFLDSLFSQRNLNIKASNFKIETLSGKSFDYSLNKLSIKNYNDIHQLTGNLTDRFNGEITAVAEIYGDPSEDESYTHLFLQGQGVDVSKLPILLEQPRFKPDSGRLDWRIWADWKNNRWQTAVGDFNVGNVVWQNEDGSHNGSATAITEKSLAKRALSKISQFKSQFSWKFIDKGIGAFNLFGIESDGDLINSNLFLIYEQRKNDLQWDIVVNQFSGNYLSRHIDLILGEYLSVNKQTPPAITFDLENLGVRLQRKDNLWKEPIVNADFWNFSLSNFGELVLLSDLSGKVSLVNGKVKAELRGTDVDIRMASLFREQISANKVTLELAAEVDEFGNPDIAIDAFEFSNPDLEVNARLRFWLYENNPIFSMYSELRNLDVGKKSTYLPVGIMEQSLVDYLDQSVESGSIPLAKAAVRGEIERFPFTKQRGVFEILGYLDQASYAFLPDWPKAEKLTAKLFFNGKGMDLQALSGSAMGVDIRHARAVINDYEEKNTPLELSLSAQLKDDNGKQFIAKTPLSQIADGLAEIEFLGDAIANIDITVGLDDSSNLKLAGEVIPDPISGKIKIDKVLLEKISGSINFNEQGLLPTQVSAKYHGATLGVKLAEIREAENSLGSKIVAEVEGELNGAIIADYLGENFEHLVSGTGLFKGKVEVGASENVAISVDILSDTKGLTFDFPGELEKQADETRELSLNVLSQSNVQKISFSWGKLNGLWDVRDKTEGAIINYDIKSSSPSASAGNLIQVNAKLESVILEDWVKFYQKIKLENESEKATPEINATLKVASLDTSISRLENVELAWSLRKNHQWRLGFHSDNPKSKIHGNLKYVPGEPLKAEIDQLVLPLKSSLFPSEESADKTATTKESIPSVVNNKIQVHKEDEWLLIENWPELDFACKNCEVYERKLGNVQLSLRKRAESIYISGNVNRNKSHALSLELKWYQQLLNEKDDNGGKTMMKNSSEIAFVLNAEDVSKLLREWNYPIGVEESRGGASGRIRWQDLPWQISPKQIEGETSFRFGKGYLSELSDAKARLFTMFNLQSLSRKLALDFKDVYKKGFFYEKLSGDVTLRKGIVETDNVFIDGNAAKVNLSGKVNLNDETIEQYALVKPQLTSSLPVLVGWAVEPTTGILMYLVNKLMEPAIEVVTQIEYRIHGPLENITVDELKKTQSKVSYENISEGEVIKKENENTESKEIEKN